MIEPVQPQEIRRNVVPQQLPEVPYPASLKPLLLYCIEFGIPVVDDRNGASKSIWVKLTETPDNLTRRVVWNLLNSGFKYLPGKGYWK